MDAGATEVQDRRDAEQASERERLQQRDEEKAASDRDEKLLRELEGGVQKSVRNLFLVLCGAADGDDKFTGMQQDLALELMGNVRPAFEAGKAAGDRALAREEFRWTKLSERQRTEMKRQGDQIRERCEASFRERQVALDDELRLRGEVMDRRSEELEGEVRDLEAQRDSLLLTVAQLSDDAVRANGSAEGLALALAGMRERAERAEGEREGLEQRVEELHKRLFNVGGAEGASNDASGGRKARKETGEDKVGQESDDGAAQEARRLWAEDVARMEKQLQEEVQRRVEADEKRSEAEARAEAAEGRAQKARESAPGGAAQVDEALLRRLKEKVAGLEKTVGEERSRHQSEMHCAGLQVQQERDARAFAETVNARMEQELVAQSRHLLKKMGVQQTHGIKNKMARHGGPQEFKDFSSELNRLVPGGMQAVQGEAQQQQQQQQQPAPPGGRAGGRPVPPPKLGLGGLTGGGGGGGGAMTDRGSRHARAIHAAAPYTAR